MLSASTALKTALQTANAINAKPRVIIEWNQNRYTPITTVDNWGSSPEATNAYDLDVFPIAEITKPVRPTAGILLGKTAEGISTSQWSDQPGSYRTYTASPTSVYKYWTSQAPSNSTPNGGGGFNISSTSASPYILYGDYCQVNKIYICFETSWASPVVYNIDITTNAGTTWTTVASNVVPDIHGVVTLYRQANGTWASTVYRANPLLSNQFGIRIAVSSMSKVNSYLNLIEMGLRLESDVTPYLIDYEVDTSTADSDFISPIGVANSNLGSVTLSNLDGLFNPTQAVGGLYRKLIDANALVTIDLGIDTTNFGGAGYEYIRQGTLYSDQWSSNVETSSISLKDQSKYLQEVNPGALLMTDVTIGQAIWRILDSVGFNNFAYTRGASESATVIPFFWTDPTKTVWENIQQLCRDTQTAVYFDANGTLQIKTREATFDKTKILASGQWTIDGALNGTKLADLISFEQQTNYEANHVKIHYKPTALAEDTQGRPISEVLWQPDGDVVLRAANLSYDMTNSQMFLWISSYAADNWPYDGMVNVRGELMKYKGKEYRYLNTSGVTAYKTIFSTDDKLHVDNDLTKPGYSWMNACSGKLILTERGSDWTTATAHDTTIAQWLSAGAAYGAYTGTQTAWNGGLTHLRSESIMRVNGTTTSTMARVYSAPHGTVYGQSPTNLGCRFRFPSGTPGKTYAGGMFIYANGALNTMYMIEVQASAFADTHRTTSNEVCVYRRDSSGLTSLVGTGTAHIINANEWHDMDITVSGNTISVWIDGGPSINVTDSSASKLTATAKFGVFVRGYTFMDFTYIYSASSGGWSTPDDDNSSYLDLINGGYYSQQNWIDGFYKTRLATRRSGKRTITYKQQYANRFFDEFGIMVHEVRPFSVTFDKFPVTYSDVYYSSLGQVVALEYIGNAFGAEFILANASREDAVVNGEDSITFGSNGVVNQKFMITGRTVQQQDEKVVEVKSASAIATRGDIPIDFQSNWLQTADAANQLGNWIVNNWSTPADQCTAEIFGNPLLELTDVIGANYSRLGLTAANNQYFITSLKHNWADGGLKTSLGLRRAFA